jgi:hypothetical protein
MRSSGEAVDETSYKGALESFVNEIGKSLKLKVWCRPGLIDKQQPELSSFERYLDTVVGTFSGCHYSSAI